MQKNLKSENLESERNLFLTLKFSENGDHVHLQESENVRFHELLKLILVILKPLQAQYHKERFFANELLSPPKGASGPSVVVLPPTRRRFQ